MDKSIPESIRDNADKHLIPLNAVLELTKRCNLSCRHCYRVVNKARKEIPTTRVISLVNELRKAGSLYVTLTGGEPLLHPDLLRICSALNDAHMAIQIFTNGTLVTAGLARELSRFNITDISLSLYGAAPETHNRITGDNASFNKTIRAVSILKRHKLPVRVKFIMMNDNIIEYSRMRKLAGKMGVYYDIDPVITPCDNGDTAPTKLRLSDEGLKKIYSRAIKTPDAKRTTPGTFSCSFGRSLCAINTYGDVYPCIQVPRSAGNIIKRPFIKVWRESKWLKELRGYSADKVKECRRCDLASYCRRCPGVAYVEEGSLYKPSREACRHARAIRELATEAQRTQRIDCHCERLLRSVIAKGKALKQSRLG
ncbi:MAG: radical SAM protein [Planctomycetes bacterium]|nr:radical SAM protein [Planctomycetota bacterium]